MNQKSTLKKPVSRISANPTPSVVGVTRPLFSHIEQLASCRALCQIGFGNTPIHRIEQYLDSTDRWTRAVAAFLLKPDVELYFPNGLPSMQNIHRLSVLHNKPVRPPKRFICGAYAPHVKPRTPHLFRDALTRYQELVVKLAPHQRWLDVKQLPYTQHTLTIIDQVLDDRPRLRQLFARREALTWLSQYLKPGVRVSAQRANGNLQSFRDLVALAVGFNGHVHFANTLGPGFRGIRTNWNELHSSIEYSQSLQDITQNTAVSEMIVTEWHNHAERLYALSRQASPVSRRIQKLSRLVNRAYEPTSDPAQFLANAQRLVFRLNIWVQAVKGGERTAALTPVELLNQLGSEALVRPVAANQTLAIPEDSTQILDAHPLLNA